MMTMQTPPGTWNPTVPTNGVNGHTRIQDAVSGVTPGVYGYANIPAGVVNTLGGIPQAYVLPRYDPGTLPEKESRSPQRCGASGVACHGCKARSPRR